MLRKDNIAKRLSLQKHPHMIALTQRLWSCALHDGETKLSFTGYETYMLCLHRLILPEFDLATSKELIQDDWARDCGRKEQLDYAYFHLSMFELVGVRSVNILEESKSMSSLGIEQDLQREMTSEAFEDYRNQVELATSTILEASKGSDQEERDDSGGEEGQKTEQPRRPSTSSGSRERKSSTADTDSNSRTKAMSLQSANGPATSRSGARGAADRKRSSGDARGAAVRNATAAKGAYVHPTSTPQSDS
ncbi:hypothetical protein BBJ28_00009846 [Nothophytophthora sp. Chile5]|nr:hypothetical protein BBJ28_00009846 [Nothophytophthora sp. Chile5]